MGMGYVYILVNDSMPGLVKIGRAKDVDQRASSLFTTGVPTPFKVVFALHSDECERLEDEIHAFLDEFRVNPDREFFRCSKDMTIETLEKLHAGHRIPGESFLQTLERQLKNPSTRNYAVAKLFSYLTNHECLLDEVVPLLIYVLESPDWYDKDYAKEQASKWLKEAKRHSNTSSQ